MLNPLTVEHHASFELAASTLAMSRATNYTYDAFCGGEGIRTLIGLIANQVTSHWTTPPFYICTKCSSGAIRIRIRNSRVQICDDTNFTIAPCEMFFVGTAGNAPAFHGYQPCVLTSLLSAHYFL